MATEPLPTFTYHPDPVATGSITASERVCECCGRARGYEYASSIYGDTDIEVLCPWCIADGNAHEQFGAEFTSPRGIGDHGHWGVVADRIAHVVANRTPGFSSWQESRWWICCDDAAAFLGPMGKTELVAYGQPAVDSIRQESGFDQADWQYYFDSLDRDRGPTAFLFRCLHCGSVGGYSDCA